VPRCTDIPLLVDDYFNPRAELPYGLTVLEIRRAMEEVYNTLHLLNSVIWERSARRFEDIVLGNTLSGMISEFLVKAVSDASSTLVRNEKVGGHPDLLAMEYYTTKSVQHGHEGIEVKSSKQRGGWQAHNPEKSWVIIFRYVLDKDTSPVEEREPTRFVQVLIANLEEKDWNLAERKPDSKRTRTVSINKHGMHKLRSNPIYQEPQYVVHPHEYSLEALNNPRPS
jgi:hypothetical protein